MDIFLFVAIKVFNVQGDGNFKVTLKECHNNISLTQSNFVKIVKFFGRCACFQVKLQLDAEMIPNTIVTPDVSDFIKIRTAIQTFHFIQTNSVS